MEYYLVLRKELNASMYYLVDNIMVKWKKAIMRVAFICWVQKTQSVEAERSAAQGKGDTASDC